MESFRQFINNHEFGKAETFLESCIANFNDNSKEYVIQLIILLSESIHNVEKAYGLTKKYLIKGDEIDQDILLLKCYIESRYYGSLDIESINTVAMFSQSKYKSHFQYFLAEHIYYVENNKDAAIKIFRENSEVNIHFVYSHHKLFEHAIQNLNWEEALNFADRIVRGIEKIFVTEDLPDYSLEFLIKESVEGSYLSKSNFDSLLFSIIDKIGRRVISNPNTNSINSM